LFYLQSKNAKEPVIKITIEIDSKSEMEKLTALFETFKIHKVNIISTDDTSVPLVKGDKTIDPTGLFGIWANKPRSLETIRRYGFGDL
jgi:hypothetical protein